MVIHRCSGSSIALDNYRANTASMNRELEKLSSGYRVNRAGDGPADLAVSEKMRLRITGLDRATRNAKDGINLIQVTEGALAEIHSMLNRMSELAQSSANGTYDGVDRSTIQMEVDSLGREITRVAETCHFNGIHTLKPDNIVSPLTGSDQEIIDTLRRLNLLNTAPLQFAISWNNSSDMDLHCRIPSGQDIYFGNRIAGGGVLDTDNQSGGPNSSEHIAFLSVNQGDEYTVSVYQYSGPMNSPVTLTAMIEGNVVLNVNLVSPLNGSLAADGNGQTEFTVVYTGRTVYNPLLGPPPSNQGLRSGEVLPLVVGGTGETQNIVDIPICNTTANALGVDRLNVHTPEQAFDSIACVKNAINQVSTARCDYGAIQNRLESTVNNLRLTSENMEAAESRIRDTDMAETMMDFTRDRILQQSTEAMMSQANQVWFHVLSLLQ